MDGNIQIYETGYNIFLNQLKNRDFPLYLSNTIDSEDEHKSVKEMLKEVREVIKWESSEKKILMDKSSYLTALSNEVYAYYHKSILQKKNVDFMTTEKKCDFTWMYTTQYYNFYYIACTLSRLNSYFVIYLEDDLAKEISSVATTVKNETLQINGASSYYIKVKEISGEVVEVTITKTRDQHKSTMKTLQSFLNKYKSSCRTDSDGIEFQLINKISQITNKQDFSFSTARNYYNYRFETAFSNSNNDIIDDSYYDDKEKMWSHLIDLDVSCLNIFNSSESLVCVTEYLYEILYKSMKEMV